MMERHLKRRNLWLMGLVLSIFPGCGGDVGDIQASKMVDGHDENPNEVMTTVKLTFSSLNGDESFTATWTDAQLSGNPEIDEVLLSHGRTYRVTLEVYNELEFPIEDLTPELRDEMEEHQVFFVGDGVESPSTPANRDAIIQQYYDDFDQHGFPVGLNVTIVPTQTGKATLKIQLRHLPALKGALIKIDGLASLMANQGQSALPGSIDIDVSFDVTVE